MLVGRDSEQHRLARLVSGARVGESSALVLTGEAGIGKSTLVEHAVGLAEGMQVLRAAGSRTEQDAAFAGLHQLLRPVHAEVRDLPQPYEAALHAALGLREGGGSDRFAVGNAVLALLTRIAEQRPLLLVVDDVHLWDASSAAALAFVARRLLVDRIGLVAASRVTSGTPLLDDGPPQLALSGLSAASVAVLVGERGAPFADRDLVRRLHRATNGNPLAVEELADQPATLLATPQAELPVPAMLAEVFGRRVAGLPARSRVATLVAALAEEDLALVERALLVLDHPGGDAARATLADLVPAEVAGLVEMGPGRVAFRHPLTRASVYATAAPDLRRAAHLAVAEALDVHDVERRTWHRCEAAAGPDDELAGALEALGAGAQGRGASAVAATAFEKGALLSSTDPERARLFLAAGRAAWLAGQADRAESLLDRAAGLVGPGDLRERVQGLRGTIALRGGSLEQARDLLLEAAAALQDTAPDAATIVLTDAVSACFYLADGLGALVVADRLADLLPRCREEENRIRGRLGLGVALVLAGRGGTDHLRSAVDALLARPPPAQDQVRPAWMVVGPLFLRESGTGAALLELTVGRRRERCALVTLPNLLFHTARHDATSDRWQTAATAYAEGVRLGRETAQTSDLTMCLAGLAWLEARTGQEQRCRDHAEQALALGARHQVHLGRAWALFALGDLELALGRPEPALAHYDTLHGLLVERGVLDVDLSPGPERAEVLVHLGRAREAEVVAEDYRERAQEKGQPWALARAARTVGLTRAAAGHDPDDCFRDALGHHVAGGDAFEQARTLLVQGEVLRRGRRRVEARVPLRSAVATFERLGARPWTDLAAVELAATGETARRRATDGVEHLTAQEQQIAQLLAAGRTTREAAAALFLSPKTVEYHLRHVYTKLAISSRDELTARLGD